MPVTRQGTNDAMTPESIQAMINRAIQRDSTHTQDDASQSSGGGLRRPVQPARVCSYTDFIKCQPLNFKGTEGVVGLSQWLKKMESVFHISGCSIDNQVKFTTCTLLGAALTWWNGHRFQELALMCTKFLADETEKVDKYINGFPDNIHGNVLSARPKTLDETINALIDITPTTLENHYDVELADGKIIGVNTIVRGCTLNFMNRPFNVEMMHVPLGSFDVIIGMDWLTKYHRVIICDEKIVRVPFRKEEAKDKSEGKRLEDVPIVKDFPKVFPEDLPGIPPTRQVEFQIDLVPGVAPVAQAPYQLAPSKMKELAEQLQELSDKALYHGEPPLRVQALVMIMGLNLPKEILEAQTEALKPENLSAEDVGGM
nr:reverse transcriptase domain-containing protein [Tanacetum cinerariifolium]